MSDPNYHSIDNDTAIGGQVRRSGVGLMRPIAVVAAIAGVGVVLYFLLAGGEREPAVDNTPHEEFRPVQAAYTDELLRMVVVVTGVATLVTYAGYVQAREPDTSFQVWPFLARFNFLWFTMVPAIYALMRAIVLLERGRYDDPTELAVKDRPMQAAVLAFMCLTAGVLSWKLWAPQ